MRPGTGPAVRRVFLSPPSPKGEGGGHTHRNNGTCSSVFPVKPLRLSPSLTPGWGGRKQRVGLSSPPTANPCPMRQADKANRGEGALYAHSFLSPTWLVSAPLAGWWGPSRRSGGESGGRGVLREEGLPPPLGGGALRSAILAPFLFAGGLGQARGKRAQRAEGSSG